MGNISEYSEYQAWWPDTGKRLEAHEWGLARALRHGETVPNQELDIVAFDGSRRTILASATPLYGPDGARVGAVAVNVDITERKVAERAEAFISGASRLLEDSLRFPPPPGMRSPIRRVLETGPSELASELDPAWLDALAVTPEHRQLMVALNPRSVMFVPLVARGRTLGVLSVASQAPSRRYQARDLVFLEDVASRAALAVDKPRVFERFERATGAHARVAAARLTAPDRAMRWRWP